MYFDLLDHQVDTQLYFKPKILGVGPDLSPLRDLSDGSHICELQNDAFSIKKALQKPHHSKKKIALGLLRYQVDTLVVILSPNYGRSTLNFWKY